MTPDQELERIQKDFEDQWERLLTIPAFKKAFEAKDVIKVGEIASGETRGNYSSQRIAKRMKEYI